MELLRPVRSVRRATTQSDLADERRMNRACGPGPKWYRRIRVDQFVLRSGALLGVVLAGLGGVGVTRAHAAMDFSWSQVKQFVPFAEFDSVGMSASGRIMAAADSCALWVSTNSGRAWTQRLSVHGPPVDCGYADNSMHWNVGISRSGQHMAVAGNHGMWTSTDRGKSWSLVENSRYYVWTGLAVSGDGSTIVGATCEDRNRRVMISTDFGKSWDESDPNSGGIVTPYFADSCYGLPAVSDDGKVVMVVLSYGLNEGAAGLFRSTDSGATWNLVATPTPPNAVFAMGGDGRTVLMPAWTPSADWGLVISSDTGLSWNDVSAPLLNNGHIWNFHITANGRYVTAAVDDGYVGSIDGGFTWKPLMDQFNAWDIAVSGNGQVALGATTHSGLWVGRSK